MGVFGFYFTVRYASFQKCVVMFFFSNTGLLCFSETNINSVTVKLTVKSALLINIPSGNYINYFSISLYSVAIILKF